MSFIITVYVNDGIVMASDRRTTYTNTTEMNGSIIRNIGIHTTNSTDKTFLCPNGAGISTCGEASLDNKPISGYINSMIRDHIKEDTPVSDIPEIVIKFFKQFDPVPDCYFLIAGYRKDKDKISKSMVFRVCLRDDKVEAFDTTLQGAVWNGETNTLTRLIQNVAVKSNDTYIDLQYEEILWNYLTLQDAVDFARFAVETTIQTMRFKNVIETVGGSVDILVIKPNETTWLQKEELH